MDPNAANRYYEEQARKKKKTQVVKQDTSEQHGILDALKKYSHSLTNVNFADNGGFDVCRRGPR
jgi:hypothetical protein